nr:13631_t:CDS:2 [Entrophospora candida]
MANVHTLPDIKGHRLGSMREQELEKKLPYSLKSKAEINDLSEKLQVKYSMQTKDFGQEKKRRNRESIQNNNEIRIFAISKPE